MSSTDLQLNPLEVYRAAEVITEEIARAAVHYVEHEMAAALPRGVCPSWCVECDGEWSSVGLLAVGELAFERFHALRISEAGAADVVWIYAQERRTEDGTVTLGEPAVWHESDPTQPVGDAAAAYRFGDDLVRAARRLEQIKAAGL